ncbi:MAG: sulfolactaldehyde 3-reductase [Bordetella sp.]|nr:sulfolactaldehyde 3-reductase [Bordetella sp.]
MNVEVGFVGLGTMGLPMARNLLRAGIKVQGVDLSADARSALESEGGRAVSSAADIDADIIVTMLPTGRHVEEALFGSGGYLETGGRTGATVVNMSTILPSECDRIAGRLESAGVHMVDAPVGRSFVHAQQGTLLIMAGGESKDIERVQPLFDAMGELTVRCGKVGAGTRMKVVNNYVSMALNALTAEGLVLAEASGLDLNVALDVMRGTSAGAGHMTATYPKRVLRGDLKPGFSVDLAHKDMSLALDMASDLHAPLAIGAAAREVYSATRAAGHGRDDFTAVYLVLRQAAGLKEYTPLLS